MISNDTIEQRIKEEYDSCYDASTDEESAKPTGDSAEICGTDKSDDVDCANCMDNDEDSVDFVVQFDERYEDPDGKIAFCCQNCRCTEKRVEKQVRNNCGNSSGDGGGNTKLYHKGCCHNDKEFTEDYLSPMMRAMNETFEGTSKKKKAKTDEVLTKKDIIKQYERAKKEEKQFENEEYDVDKTSQTLTNAAYCESCRDFMSRSKDRKGGLRVLELFAGIGSGTVVLKRLGIPITSIVHVEHDPLAVQIIMCNHNEDGIKHVYVEKFEEIFGTDTEPDPHKLEDFFSQHGPFDLVTSGAPCQNLSGINAYRNIDAESAQYLMKAGKLIKKLDNLQKQNGVKERILFLSENVVFREFETADVHYSDFSPEGLSPMRIDAKDFGPVKRNRLYWINIPVNSADHIKDVASEVSADVCLEPGWRSIVHLLDDDPIVFKSNAFLASPSTIDDTRMQSKYKEDTTAPADKYSIETYSVAEREKMMGLPEGYIEKPLKYVFEQLEENAFKLPEVTVGKTYRDFLPRNLWHFRKKCHFKFEAKNDEPFFQLLISSPLEGKKDLVYFNQKEYGKHLIGNGWSIPVVEHLLGKLRDLFDDDHLVTYEGYDYNFPWAPYSN